MKKRRLVGRSKLASPRALVLGALCVAVAQCGAIGEAKAWDPFKSLGKSLGSGLAEGAHLPTLPQAEATGHRLIGDLNDRVEARIDQLQGAVSSDLNQLDAMRKAGLDQADGIMQARITQLGGVVDSAVGSAVGGLDLVAKRRITQLQESGLVLIGALNQDLGQQLDKVDSILQGRIGQLDDVVARSLADMDEILRARIDQVDELTERRLANADVMVTRQGVALEASLLQLGKWLGLLVFLVYAAIRGYADFAHYWAEHEAKGKSYRQNVGLSLGKALAWTAGRAAVALLCALALRVVIEKIPTSSQDRLAELKRQNLRDFEDSRDTLSFSRVRFYQSQLELLESDPQKRSFYRREARKYELARNALLRATLTRQGVRDALNEIAAFEGEGDADADLLALKAYLTFRGAQMSDDRADEAQAASYAEQALKATAPAGSPDARAVFKPLAAGVLRALLHDPVPRSQVAVRFADLSQTLQSFGDTSFGPLAHAVAYDRAVSALDAESSSGFIAMVEAQARALRATSALGKLRPKLVSTDAGVSTSGLQGADLELATALDERFKAAARVVDAWQKFDRTLQDSELIATSSAVFGVFSLNDAVLTQALWVRLNPLAPELAKPVKSITPCSMRLAVAPVRLEWARRYGAALGRGASFMFGFEEARRYDLYEQQVQGFITALVELRAPSAAKPEKGKADAKPKQKPEDTACGAALPGDGSGTGATGSPALRAALAAASLGLYDGPTTARKAYGLTLLGEGARGEDEAVVLGEYGKRHLLLL